MVRVLTLSLDDFFRFGLGRLGLGLGSLAIFCHRSKK
jgi:hypothetical protein